MRSIPPELRVAYVLLFLAVSCQPRPDEKAESTARHAIEAQLARSNDATKREDIDAYLSVLAPDFQVENDSFGDEHGETLSRDEMRAAILRDWGIITEHRVVETKIDSLFARGDSAVVFTSQRYERLMLQRDGITVDTVFTSVTHQELWRRGPQDWLLARVRELAHGPILINGQIYDPR